MPRRRINLSDEHFVLHYQTRGPSHLAKMWGVTLRSIHAHRIRVEGRLGIKIVAADTRDIEIPQVCERLEIPMTDGVVIVGGDAHYWPGDDSTAHRAFVRFGKELKPAIVVMNGDAADFPGISRHPPIGWENIPTIEDELAYLQIKMGEIVSASPRARHIWPLGNHDARFNTRLAMVASEFAGVTGTRLVHHFPEWEPTWAVAIGGRDGAVIKHRFKGGIHATHNNTLWAGRTLISGHLHSQKVTPFTDYNGTRWGVDTGTIANPLSHQFRHYTEDNPLNWRSGFVVLTWQDGRLLPPELVSVLDEDGGVIHFRGKTLKV